MPNPLVPDFDWKSHLEPVYRLYSALMRDADPVDGLGGKLLYAGELHEEGCRLVRAANIAGAASLSATADPTALRHANRGGVADFLVNSLDEALRILKNEVRKRQTVSVGVSISPSQMVAEMRERGVLPDLLPPAAREDAQSPDLSDFHHYGAQYLEPRLLPPGYAFRAWSLAPPGWEDVALAALPESDYANRRWLRLSPRYLGPAARRVRSFAASAGVLALVEAAAVGEERP